MTHNIKQIIQNYQAKPFGNHPEFAVLLPLIKIGNQIHILFEVRSQKISQPGDTSFPGGKIEANESAKKAAIRETTEELLIDSQQIEIYGQIDFIVRDWAVIYCFVGELIDFDISSYQSNDEVDHLFTVPLQYFIENNPVFYPINIEEKFSTDFPFDRIHCGEDYQFHRKKTSVPFYNLPSNVNEQLWGMTANMVHRFSEILRGQLEDTDTININL